MNANMLRDKWQEGKVTVGPFVKIPAIAIAEICGYSGFEFVIMDMEHGPLSITVTDQLVRGALVGGAVPLIRVPKLDPVMIQQAMDTGCAGVVIPQVTSADNAMIAVQSAKFWPEGSRGVCRYVGAAKYSAVDKNQYFKLANKETLVIVMIEGKAGLDNLDEILEVPGIDVVFIGPYDLSQSLGLTGQTSHPDVLEVMRRAVNKITNKGLVAGTFTDTIEGAKKWVGEGVKFLAHGNDTGIISAACREVRKSIG